MELLNATVTKIFDLQTKNNFTKREVMVSYMDDTWERQLLIQVIGDKVQHVAGLEVGDNVHVKFNVETRESNGKYYTNATCFYIRKCS